MSDGRRPPRSVPGARDRSWPRPKAAPAGWSPAALTDVAGSSDVFDRGFVTYSNAAKTEMLGVRAETLDAHGAVSEPVAREMAEGALARSRADLAVAVTGIAGPGGSEHKPEGRVCFAVAADRADDHRDGRLRRPRPGRGARGQRGSRAGIAAQRARLTGRGAAARAAATRSRDRVPAPGYGQTPPMLRYLP